MTNDERVKVEFDAIMKSVAPKAEPTAPQAEGKPAKKTEKKTENK